MEKQYDSDGREYTPSQPIEPEVVTPGLGTNDPVVAVIGLNEPVATESTEPASEPVQSKE